MAEVKAVAAIAAKWWRNKITDTANLSNHSNGESGDLGFMTALLGSMLAMNHTPSTKKADVFEEELSRLITRKLDESPSNCISLSCDYGPDETLYEAAEAAGIDPSVFPFKRYMRISLDGVEVRDGYGEPFIMLSSSEEG
ncbi:MAG: hypothetical protein J6J36_01825 [Clostridia bacterium]|nr:hypothetical protein [Clostridia bacterium]